MGTRKTFNFWTSEEDQILRDTYPRLKVAEILPLLSRHTRVAIHARASHMGLNQENPYSRERGSDLRERLSEFRKEYYLTHDVPFKGEHHTAKSKEAIKQATIRQMANPSARALCSDTMKRYYSDPRNREAVGIRQRAFFSDPLNKETLEKVRLSSKLRFNDPEFLRKYHAAFLRKPNKLEQRVIRIVDQLSLPFKYNGDYSQGVSLNCKIPDFINVNGKKQVIEVFGDYWHGHKYHPESDDLEEERTRVAYRSVGFDCLILWEHNIKAMTDQNIGERIKSFC